MSTICLCSVNLKLGIVLINFNILLIEKNNFSSRITQPFNNCLNDYEYDGVEFKEWRKKLKNAIKNYNSACELQLNMKGSK